MAGQEFEDKKDNSYGGSGPEEEFFPIFEEESSPPDLYLKKIQSMLPSSEAPAFTISDEMRQRMLTSPFSLPERSRDYDRYDSERPRRRPPPVTPEMLESALKEGDLHLACTIQDHLKLSSSEFRERGFDKLLVEALWGKYATDNAPLDRYAVRIFPMEMKELSLALIQRAASVAERDRTSLSHLVNFLVRVPIIDDECKFETAKVTDRVFANSISDRQAIPYLRSLSQHGREPSREVTLSADFQKKGREIFEVLILEDCSLDEQQFINSLARIEGTERREIFGRQIENAIRNERGTVLRNLLRSKCFQDGHEYGRDIKLAAAKQLPGLLEKFGAETAFQAVRVIRFGRVELEVARNIEAVLPAIFQVASRNETSRARDLIKALDLNEAFTEFLLRRTQSELDKRNVPLAASYFYLLGDIDSLRSVTRQQATKLQQKACGQIALIITSSDNYDFENLSHTSRRFGLTADHYSEPSVHATILRHAEKLLHKLDVHRLQHLKKLTSNSITLSDEGANRLVEECFNPQIYSERLSLLIDHFNFKKEAIWGLVTRRICSEAEDFGWSPEYSTCIKLLGIPVAELRTPDARRQLTQAALCNLRNAQISNFRAVLDVAEIRPDEIRERALPAFLDALADSPWQTGFSEVIDLFGWRNEMRKASSELRQNALEALDLAFSEGEDTQVLQLHRIFQFTTAELDNHLPDLIVSRHAESFDEIVDTESLLDALNYKPERQLPVYHLSHRQLVAVTHFQIKTIAEFIRLGSDYGDYFDWVAQTGDSFQLTRDDLVCLPVRGQRLQTDKLPITLLQAHTMKRDGLDIVAVHRDGRYDILFEHHRRTTDVWRHLPPSDLIDQIKAEIGPQAFLRLVHEGGFDADHLPQFWDFCKAVHRVLGMTDITRSALYNRVFLPVVLDKSEYGVHGSSKNAAGELRTIIDKYRIDVGALLERASKYSYIPEVAALLPEFKQAGFPFTSWQSLLLYAKCQEIFFQEGIMDELSKERDRNPGLYTFLTTLMFDPGCRVKWSVVHQFWRYPGDYINSFPKGEIMNSDLPPLLHRLKPSCFVQSAALDVALSGKQVCHALVDGTLDKLQRFTPLSIEFQIPQSGMWYESTREALLAALGSRQEGISGRATVARKLFKLVNTQCKAVGIDFKRYLAGEIEIPAPLEERILHLVYNSPEGIKENWTTILATVHAKSDPAGLSAADDTASCMPLGSVKGNIFLWDPNTALFTLRLKQANGSYRAIGESVLTRDAHIGQEYSAIYKAMKIREGCSIADMSQLVRACPPINSEITIGCDNIQMAPNFANSDYAAIVQGVFANFFRRYTQIFGNYQNLNPDYVTVGQESSTCVDGLDIIDSHFIPLHAPIGYSDRCAAGVFQLPITKPPLFLAREVHRGTSAPRYVVPRSLEGPQVRPLEYTGNSLQVAHLSDRAAAKRASGRPGIQNLKVQLGTIELGNEVFGRPNLGLVHVDERGQVNGMLVAYEGAQKDPNCALVRVSDFIVEGNSAVPGRRLVREFVARYHAAYERGPGFLPIVLIVNSEKVARLGKGIKREFARVGLDCRLEGGGPRIIGDEMRMEVIIHPRRMGDSAVVGERTAVEDRAARKAWGDGPSPSHLGIN